MFGWFEEVEEAESRKSKQFPRTNSEEAVHGFREKFSCLRKDASTVGSTGAFE